MNDYEKILTLLLVFHAFTLSFQISVWLMLKDLRLINRNFKRDMEQLRIDHERRMAELNKPYFPQSVYDPPVE